MMTNLLGCRVRLNHSTTEKGDGTIRLVAVVEREVVFLVELADGRLMRCLHDDVMLTEYGGADLRTHTPASWRMPIAPCLPDAPDQPGVLPSVASDGSDG